MNDRKKLLMFKITFFIEYVGQAIAYCLLIPYLTNIGYSAMQRSAILSFGAVLGTVLQFYVGYLCDRNRTIKRYLNIMNVVFALCCVLLYRYSEYNYLFHFITASLVIMFFKVVINVYDSYALESGEELKKRYGIIRAYGSIGWAVGSEMISRIVEKGTYKMLALAAVIAIALLIMVNTMMDDAIKISNEKINWNDVGRLMKKKTYVLIVASLTFCYTMMVAIDFIIVDKILYVGGAERHVSLFWSVMAICELPLFFTGNRLVRRYGAIAVYGLSVIIYSLRYLLYGMSDNLNFVLVLSVLQGLTFPLTMVATKELVDDESPESLKSSGQLIGLAIYNNIPSLIAPLLTGYLEDSVGINSALYTLAGFGLVSLALLWMYCREKKKTIA
ncbi:MAG: MFS transporter [Erysipelotrichaceae bacterium]|nr:MFS transporter [Erysipelotrichaceae bacterium]